MIISKPVNKNKQLKLFLTFYKIVIIIYNHPVITSHVLDDSRIVC
jgi:hypothetical protein